jgi:hypothetical protein
MINKKLLAASIAAAFTFNAHAVIDINTATTALDYATQTVASGGLIATNAKLDAKVNVGLNLPAATTFYVRFDYGNAKIATSALAANGSDLSIAPLVGTDTVNLEGGGQIGDSYAVFSFSNTLAIASTEEFTVALGTTGAGLTVTSNAAPVTMTYKLYEASNSLAALNGGAGEVATASLAAINFVTGQDVAGSFTAVANTALVAKQFMEFKDAGGNTTATKASLGQVLLLPEADVLDGATSADVLVAAAYSTPAALTATVTGDFSFGTWTVDTVATCATTAAAANTVVVATGNASGTVPVQDYTAAKFLCVTVDGETVVPRVSTAYTYAVSGTNNTSVAGSLGTITYDTTAITVPYVTTFSGYNQRVYILNNSSIPASYTTTFQTEAGVTATAGTAATGTVPAKTMMAIKATDLVTFAGATRGAAVIEIEAGVTNVEATTQTVNKSNGGTDTTTLEVTGS